MEADPDPSPVGTAENPFDAEALTGAIRPCAHKLEIESPLAPRARIAASAHRKTLTSRRIGMPIEYHGSGTWIWAYRPKEVSF